MPNAPTRVCGHGHVTSGRGECRLCYAARDAVRGTRGERGYDQAWQRLRDRHARDNPLCAECWRFDRIEAMSDVDHIVPFATFFDPLRLDPTNLQSLCKSCHKAKSAIDWANKRKRAPRDGVGGRSNVYARAPYKPRTESPARDRTTSGRVPRLVLDHSPGRPDDDDGPVLA